MYNQGRGLRSHFCQMVREGFIVEVTLKQRHDG